MKMNKVILVLILWFHNTLAQKGLQCFVPGECLDSQILGATPTDDSKECWRHCQNVTGCTWFTFYKDSKICTPLSGCLRLSNEKCLNNCISGEEECPEVQCGVHGRCYGALEGIRKVGSAKECGTICESHQECFWNTYDPEHQSCLMTNDCPLMDRSCNNCSSSERNCVANSETREIGTTGAYNALLLGPDHRSINRFFNTETKTIGECNLPSLNSKDPDWQFTTINNELHVCIGALNEKIVCFKFDNEKRTWNPTANASLRGFDFYFYLNLPNGQILVIVQSAAVFKYTGEKIERVTINLPRTRDDYKAAFCRTAISNDEILFGFAPEVIPANGTASTELYSLKVNSVPANIAKIEVPKIEATNFVCGAYGPEGNRKVAIFGGNQYMNGLPNGPFEKTLILDWNSKTLDVNGPSLKAANPNEHEEQTIAFGDTFMFYKYRYTETKIFQFDPNGKETKIPFVGSIPGRCSDLAVVPINVIGCT